MNVSNRVDLNIHFELLFIKKFLGPYRCKYCVNGFKSLISLKRHITAIHSKEINHIARIFTCNKCGQFLPNADKYYDHLQQCLIIRDIIPIQEDPKDTYLVATTIPENPVEVYNTNSFDFITSQLDNLTTIPDLDQLIPYGSNV